MNVILPPVFQIDLKEDDNVVRQLAVPAWSGEATVEPFTQKRVRGFKIIKGNDATPVLLITSAAQPDPEWMQVIKSRGLDFDASTCTELDLTNAHWVKHPKATQVYDNIGAYKANVEKTRASWLHAFAYKREDRENNILGLRPPQIGAIYAVQAHWTVNTDIATVVLPTGVGKTETMLSLLVAERCQRLLVVVPTDALRTQIADKFITFGLLKTADFKIISEKALYPVVGIMNRRPTTVMYNGPIN